MKVKSYALALILIFGVSFLVSVSAAAADPSEPDISPSPMVDGGEVDDPTPTPEATPEPTPEPTPELTPNVEHTEQFDDDLSALTAINVKVGRLVVMSQYQLLFMGLLGGVMLGGIILLIVSRWWGGRL